MTRYENFFPPAFKPLQVLAHVPGAVFLIGQSLRVRAVRRQPTAYGWVTRRADDALLESWVRPALASAAIRREVAALLKGISKRYTLDAATHFAEFAKPVLIAWAPEDRFFKLRDGERLAAAFPDARLELIEDSYTFVPIDQPERTASLIKAFVSETPAAATPSRANASATSASAD